MSRLRIILLSLVAVCAVSMLTTAVASAAGPFWHINGSKLKQGSNGVKGQSKGSIVLKGTTGGVAFTITCTAATTEGTIDGQGETRQGQEKMKATMEGCKIETSPEIKGCSVPATFSTNQMKAGLALATVQGTEQIADLFEASPNPQAEGVIASIKIATCGVLTGTFPIKGSVVGALSPQEVESQEASLVFPEEPITKATREGQAVTAGATLGGGILRIIWYIVRRLIGGSRYGPFRN